MENSLLSLLPDLYESMDVLGVYLTGGCKGGYIDTQACGTGQSYQKCSTGGCYS
jgi:hypothetical protein